MIIGNYSKTIIQLNLLQKPLNQGFTLIELLVVFLVSGALSAVTLPILLNQVGKSRETEAKTMLGNIRTAQIAYFFQNRHFADTNEKLGIGMNGQEYNYPQPVINASAGATQVIHEADALNPINENKRDYAIGIVYQNQAFSVVLCQSEKPGQNALPSSTNLGICDQGKKIQ